MVNKQKSSFKIVFLLKRGIVMFQGAKNLAVNHLPLERGLAVQK